MGKIENLEKYIVKCERFIKDRLVLEDGEKDDFLKEIESVYKEEIKGFTNGLNYY